MRVTAVQEQWIHTHFILDSGILSAEATESISRSVAPILRRHGILYDYHIAEEPNKGFTRLILECIPLERVREELHRALAEAIAPFPAESARDTVVGIRVADDATE